MGFPVKFLSGRDRFVGFGLITDIPITLDPTQYEGAMVYGVDKRMYYSDGNVWIKLLEVPIDQPAALPPITAEQQLRLRLTAFRSSVGYTHSSTEFRIYRNKNTLDPSNPLLKSEVKQRNINLPDPDYDLTYLQLGLDDLATLGGFGGEYWWTGTYYGGGFSSDPSVSFRQFFPKELQDPIAITADLATADAVRIDPFETAFPQVFVYDGSRVELYEVAQDGGQGAQIGSGINYGSGDSLALNGELDITALPTKDGVPYFWRAQHFARPLQLVPGVTGNRVASEWTNWRVVKTIPSTLVLVYDLSKRGSSSRLVELPLNLNTGDTCTIDWGDGSTQAITGPSSTWIQHTWAGTATKFEIRVAGTVRGFGNVSISGKEENQKILIGCTAIGAALKLTSLSHAFLNCVNFVQAPDVLPRPEGSYLGVTNLFRTFSGCSVFNWDISNWDVTNVREVGNCFYNCTSFNQDISSWNVGNVTGSNSFRFMFYGCTAFDRSLNDWGDVLSRGDSLDFDSMFENCAKYNGPMSKWAGLNITSMNAMFAGCKVFNQPLGTWDTSTCISLYRVFDGAERFNKPLTSWNTANIRNMAYMFRNANAFTQDLSSWDVGACTDFSFMFDLYGIREASRNLDWTCNVGGWGLGTRLPSADTKIALSGMFRYRKGFNDDVTAWPAQKMDSTAELFSGCAAFSRNISTWNMSGVRDAAYMFNGCTAFNQPIGNWNFTGIGGVDGAQGGSIRGLLQNCSAFNQPILWNLNHSGVTSLYAVFAGCKSLGSAGVVAGAGQLLNPTSPLWAKYVTDLGYLFAYCANFNEDLSHWMLNDPSGATKPVPVTSLRHTFVGCSSFTNGGNTAVAAGIGGWDVSQVQYFTGTFRDCTYFNRSISAWNVRKALDTQQMFWNCSLFNQPLSGPDWKLPLCVAMDYMFYACTKFNQNINGLFEGVADAQLKYASHVFRLTTAFNNGQAATLEPVTGAPVAGTAPLTWALPLLETAHWMFLGAAVFNQNINSLRTAPLTSCWAMLSGAARFNNGGTGGTTSTNDELKLDVSRVSDLSQLLRNNYWFNQSFNYLEPLVCTNFSSMLEGCQRFNQGTASFGGRLSINPSVSINLDNFFANCWAFNQAFSSWRFTRVNSLKYFLYNCPAWKRSAASWDVRNVNYMAELLGSSGAAYASGMTEMDYAATLENWANLAGLQTMVTVNFGTSPPNAAAVAARSRLVALKRWTIRDASGLHSPPPV
jgi:surface protein